jgi:hypothetical protein
MLTCTDEAGRTALRRNGSQLFTYITVVQASRGPQGLIPTRSRDSRIDRGMGQGDAKFGLDAERSRSFSAVRQFGARVQVLSASGARQKIGGTIEGDHGEPQVP